MKHKIINWLVLVEALAAGSLLSYALKITHLDPIRWGLQFSRFLRKEMPRIIQILIMMFLIQCRLRNISLINGAQIQLIPITNWNTFQLKSLVKDISKFYDVPYQEVNNVTMKMDEEAIPEAKRANDITAGVYTPTYEEYIQYSPSFASFIRKYPQVGKFIPSLLGQIKSQSRHAGGVILSENLDENMPLVASGGVIQSPWAEGQHLRHLEPLGFIKFDILGIASLRMIEGCIRRILINQGIEEPTFDQIKEWYEDNLTEQKLDLSDEETYKNVFQGGKFIGTFQFAEKNAQQFCMNAKPESLVEISNITSIYRPGPLSVNVDKDYVYAKDNPKTIIFKHPLIKEALGDTYGFLIYQEQIALLARINLEKIFRLMKVIHLESS
jgi:DNA polymerase-3 subunit alpha